MRRMVNEDDAMAHCCAECGEEGGVVSLKACMSCKSVKYCNAKCQRNHWAKHKKRCERRAAELCDEALFKDPPPKEDCPICFLPMPTKKSLLNIDILSRDRRWVVVDERVLFTKSL